MEQAQIADLRVLIVGGTAHAVQTLRTVLGNAGIGQVTVARESRRALDLLRSESYSAVFCDEHAAQADHMSFALAARRSPGMLNPMVPIFVIYGGPRRSQVERARDIGATDVLTRPISVRTVLRKLHVALAHPRPFIVAPEFFGPDRRVQDRKTFRGKERRKRLPKKHKVHRLGGANILEDSDTVLV
jgi:CheY-like chemotaxis protein